MNNLPPGKRLDSIPIGQRRDRARAFFISRRSASASLQGGRNMEQFTYKPIYKEEGRRLLELNIVYYGKNVPLFRRNGYRKPGAMIP